MHRYRRYGLTKPKYDELMIKQDGKCPLCLEKLKEDINTCVDHCHNSLVVRGITCRGCNMVLSRFEDVEYIKRVAAYLGDDEFDDQEGGDEPHAEEEKESDLSRV